MITWTLLTAGATLTWIIGAAFLDAIRRKP